MSKKAPTLHVRLMSTLLQTVVERIAPSPNMAVFLDFENTSLTVQLDKLLSKEAWTNPKDLLELSAIFALMYLKSKYSDGDAT